MGKGLLFIVLGKDAGEDAESEEHCKTLSKDRQKHLAGSNTSPPIPRHHVPTNALKNTNFSATGMEKFSLLISAGSKRIKRNPSLLFFFFPLRSRATVSALLRKLQALTDKGTLCSGAGTRLQGPNTLQLKSSQLSLGAGPMIRPQTCREGLPHESRAILFHWPSGVLHEGLSGRYKVSKDQSQQR